MTKRKTSGKVHGTQVERIRRLFYSRHLTHEQIARALRVSLAAVRRALAPGPKQKTKPKKKRPVPRSRRSARELWLEYEVERLRKKTQRLGKRLQKKRQASAARGLEAQRVRKLFAAKLGKPTAYTVEAWRRELRKMSHEERIAFVSKHYKKIAATTGLAPKEVFAMGISP